MKWALLSVILLLPIAAVQASEPTNSNPSFESLSPVVRINTRMVLVDVSVLGKDGKFVKDLKATDFTVLENGKPQSLADFSTQSSQGDAAGPLPTQNLPPHVCTNRPEYAMPAGPLTVLLLDTLNTGTEDQAYVRSRMLQFVDNQLPPHERVAVFSLGESLLQLQGFTDDPELLKAAIRGFVPEKSSQLEMEALAKRLSAAQGGGGAGEPASTRVHILLERLHQFYAEEADYAQAGRVRKTLAGFRMLARALGGNPGRKNLIWLSAGFPLTSTYSPADHERANGQVITNPEVRILGSYVADFQRTVALLSTAQVAVYPVDARGLVGPIVSEAALPDANQLGKAKIGREFGSEVRRQGDGVIENQETMTEFAAETGGRVYKNRNDIDRAVRLSMEDGASYYALAYYPQDKNWNGKFRRIQVKLSQPELNLRYRQGYYAASPEAEQPNDQTAEIASELDPLSPDATLVIFDAKLNPPPPGAKLQVGVDFLVNISTLSAPQDHEGKRSYDVEFHAAAYTPDGKEVAHQDVRLKAAVKLPQYTTLQQQGLPFHTQLDLPPGRYQIRLAVRDTQTGYMGTSGMPLVLNSQ